MNNLHYYSQNIIRFGLIIFAFSSPFALFFAEMGIAISFLGWILKIISVEKLEWKKSPLDIPILIYLLSQVIASLLGITPINSLKDVMDTEWAVVLYFILTNNIKDEKFIKQLVGILIMVSSIMGIYGIYQYYTGLDLYKQKIIDTQIGGRYRASGNFGLSLTFGGYQMAVFFVALGIVFGIKDIKEKLFFAVLSIPIFLSVFASLTRSAVIGVLAGVVLFIILKIKRKFVLAVISVIVVILTTVILPEILSNISHFFNREYDTERLKLYQTSINIIKDFPIFGIGPGNFGFYFDSYKELYLYEAIQTHSIYLEVAVHTGLIGLICFLWIWGTFLYYGYKRYKLIEDNYFKNFVLGTMLGIFAFLVAGNLQNYYTDLEDTMLWWFIVGGCIVISTDKHLMKNVT
jgi:putative inorganic carbon (HCO3(-)) transporter